MGREFQTLLGLLLLPLHQLPTLGLGIGICCPESRPHEGRPYSRSLKSPLFLAGVPNGHVELRVKAEPRSSDWDLRFDQRPPILPPW